MLLQLAEAAAEVKEAAEMFALLWDHPSRNIASEKFGDKSAELMICYSALIGTDIDDNPIALEKAKQWAEHLTREDDAQWTGLV
jgi:hypothetical protein